MEMMGVKFYPKTGRVVSDFDLETREPICIPSNFFTRDLTPEEWNTWLESAKGFNGETDDPDFLEYLMKRFLESEDRLVSLLSTLRKKMQILQEHRRKLDHKN